ncbi:lytic transglycosylase domain-containing protein, partial [Deltaproteobacteria bacterium OttesenSCG-928-M10]|nr:lytic transglycosylase domain-containing protein [Deltaproteobacteria bacterium OttesenSCG-928-M10]
KHLTNAPTDPRYRLFTVQVKVQRGLAGKRVRFTHNTLRPIIMKAAAAYNLDPALIAAVIKSESAFDSQAVSWAGAQGLMQLMPATGREMGCRDPFDPEENVMAGSRYLRRMLNRFNGDLTLAIAAYNCGPERVARNWRVPNIAETQNYVVIVSRNYERYKQQF